MAQVTDNTINQADRISAPIDALMWSLTKIAEREHVTKQAVSKNVRGMLSRGEDITVERTRVGYVIAVNVIDYYRLLGKPVDPSELNADRSVANWTSRAAMHDAVRRLERQIDGLPSHARAIAEAAARDGESGVATVLKAMVFDLRKELLEASRTK